MRREGKRRRGEGLEKMGEKTDFWGGSVNTWCAEIVNKLRCMCRQRIKHAVSVCSMSQVDVSAAAVISLYCDFLNAVCVQ